MSRRMKHTSAWRVNPASELHNRCRLQSTLDELQIRRAQYHPSVPNITVPTFAGPMVTPRGVVGGSGGGSGRFGGGGSSGGGGRGGTAGGGGGGGGGGSGCGCSGGISGSSGGGSGSGGGGSNGGGNGGNSGGSSGNSVGSGGSGGNGGNGGGGGGSNNSGGNGSGGGVSGGNGGGVRSGGGSDGSGGNGGGSGNNGGGNGGGGGNDGGGGSGNIGGGNGGGGGVSGGNGGGGVRNGGGSGGSGSNSVNGGGGGNGGGGAFLRHSIINNTNNNIGLSMPPLLRSNSPRRSVYHAAPAVSAEEFQRSFFRGHRQSPANFDHWNPLVRIGSRPRLLVRNSAMVGSRVNGGSGGGGGSVLLRNGIAIPVASIEGRMAGLPTPRDIPREPMRDMGREARGEEGYSSEGSGFEEGEQQHYAVRPINRPMSQNLARPSRVVVAGLRDMSISDEEPMLANLPSVVDRPVPPPRPPINLPIFRRFAANNPRRFVPNMAGGQLDAYSDDTDSDSTIESYDSNASEPELNVQNAVYWPGVHDFEDERDDDADDDLFFRR